MTTGYSNVSFLVPGGCLGDTLSPSFYPPELEPPVLVEFEFMNCSSFDLKDFPSLSGFFTLAYAAAVAIENCSACFLLNSLLMSGDFLWLAVLSVEGYSCFMQFESSSNYVFMR